MKDLRGIELQIGDNVAYSDSHGTKSSCICIGKIVEIKKFNKFDRLTVETEINGYKYYRDNHNKINIQSNNVRYDKVLKI